LAPPLTFTFARSISPSAWGRLSCSLANLSDANAFSLAMICAANASFNSIRSMSRRLRPVFSRSLLVANTGPRPMRLGSQPA